ncbi:MAG: type II toxin-antitoxin system VapC family toxin [Dehalococcoidia bacterium]
MPTFVDTSAYYAFAVPRDREHRQAVDIFRMLAQRRFPLYTTNLIIAESHALLKSRLLANPSILRQAALTTSRTFIEGIYASSVLIEPVTSADERTALALLAQYSDQDFSFTDGVSFVVMQRLGIRHAFSFDADYVTVGFIDI